MKRIRTQEDADNFRAYPELEAIVKSEYKVLSEIPNYNPDNDGFIYVIEYGDLSKEVKKKFGRDLDNMIWDGLYLKDDIWIGFVLTNNQFGWTIIIPNADWLTLKIKNALKREAGIK